MAAQQPQSSAGGPGVDQDPIAKYKALIPRLKESLSKLMEVAAIAFYQNSQSDNCIRPSEITSERFDKCFDKCLEEFYAICDQMEILLKLALECASFSADSTKHTPVPVWVPQQQQTTQNQPPPPQPPGTQIFSQYLHTVKTHINCAKEVHDQLVDCAVRLSDTQRRTLSSQQQQQTPAQPQGSQIPT